MWNTSLELAIEYALTGQILKATEWHSFLDGICSRESSQKDAIPYLVKVILSYIWLNL